MNTLGAGNTLIQRQRAARLALDATANNAVGAVSIKKDVFVEQSSTWPTRYTMAQPYSQLQ